MLPFFCDNFFGIILHFFITSLWHLFYYFRVILKSNKNSTPRFKEDDRSLSVDRSVTVVVDFCSWLCDCMFNFLFALRFLLFFSVCFFCLFAAFMRNKLCICTTAHNCILSRIILLYKSVMQ